jgi:hypothetical protein
VRGPFAHLAQQAYVPGTAEEKAILMAAIGDTQRDAVGPPNRRKPLYERLSGVIDSLDMTDDKKGWMRERWLEQVCWFDETAERANRRHSYLRVLAIAGGVLIPGLVSIDSASSAWEWVRPVAFVVSLMVAAAVGLDEFFHFGERWRHYRRTAELLKTEGWLFIEGGGDYRRLHRKDFHNHVFPRFATKVEELVKRDVEVYLTRIVQERQDDVDDEEAVYADRDEGEHDSTDPTRAHAHDSARSSVTPD